MCPHLALKGFEGRFPHTPHSSLKAFPEAFTLPNTEKALPPVPQPRLAGGPAKALAASPFRLCCFESPACPVWANLGAHFMPFQIRFKGLRVTESNSECGVGFFLSCHGVSFGVFCSVVAFLDHRSPVIPLRLGYIGHEPSCEVRILRV